jgi:hypothetical protein
MQGGCKFSPTVALLQPLRACESAILLLSLPETIPPLTWLRSRGAIFLRSTFSAYDTAPCAASQRSGYRSVPPKPDGAVSPGPIAAGRFLGRGTEACARPVAAGLTVEALTVPVMVSPTCICPLASPARTIDEGSRQRMKANLHIFSCSWRAINRPISQQCCAGMGRFCLPFDMAVAVGQRAAIPRPAAFASTHGAAGKS